MNTTVTLTASGCYGNNKQYIARVTGRDSKFTFAREFVGRKEGKRGESTTFTTDEPGLYLTCDIDRKDGKAETYCLVYDLPGYGLTESWIELEEAMQLAKRLEGETMEWTAVALTRRLIMAEAQANQDELVTLKLDSLGLKAGKLPRRELVAALKNALGLTPVVIMTTDAKTEAIARVKALMAELGVTVADLA